MVKPPVARDIRRVIRRYPACVLALLACLLLPAVDVLGNDRIVRNTHAEERPDVGVDHVFPLYDQLVRSEQLDAANRKQAVALMQRYVDLHTAMQYEAAAELADELVTRWPDHPAMHYNHACTLARLYRTSAALDALEQAIENGWNLVEHTQVDPDLASIRWTDRYEQLIERMRAIADTPIERMPEPGPLRTDAWEQIAAEIDRQMPQWLAHHHTPGVAIALIDENRLVWSAGYGTACLETGEAMSDEHLVRFRAPAHLLALAGAMDAERAGHLRIVNVLRDARRQVIRARLDRARRGASREHGSQLTAQWNKDAHRSGRALREVTSPSLRNESRRWTGRYEAGSTTMPLDASITFQTLCQAIEESDSQCFKRFSGEQFLRPIGIQQCRFQPHVMPGAMSVAGHDVGHLSPSEISHNKEIMAVSARDLGRLMELFAQRDSTPASQEWIHLWRRMQILNRPDIDLTVRVERSADGLMVEAGDEWQGQGGLIRWYPERGRGIVVLYNASGSSDLADRIARTALGGGR